MNGIGVSAAKTNQGQSMHRRHFICCLAAVAGVPGIGFARELKPYTGPEITRVVLHKSRRRLYLLSGDTVVKDYKVGLGSHPRGQSGSRVTAKRPKAAILSTSGTRIRPFICRSAFRTRIFRMLNMRAPMGNGRAGIFSSTAAPARIEVRDVTGRQAVLP